MLVNRAIFACLGLVVAATFTTMDSRSAAGDSTTQIQTLQRQIKELQSRVKSLEERFAVAVANGADRAEVEVRIRKIEVRLDDIEFKHLMLVDSRLESDCKDAETNLNGPDPTPLAHSFLSACIADIRQALRSLE